jgi:hypothetical protein
MGLTKVTFGRRPNDDRINAYVLSNTVQDWLEANVGVKGQQWSWAYLGALRWEVQFSNPQQAMLFKLTWA